MQLLYSNIFPLSTEENQLTIADCILQQFAQCDSADIAVGYVSKASLEELDQIVEQLDLKNINLIIGMYYTEGMPEVSYRHALKMNEKWRNKGIGEVRLVRTFKYHGKVYIFKREGVAFSSVMGSANLGVIKPDAANIRQYEISGLIKQKDELNNIVSLVNKLKENKCSVNISDIVGLKLIRETNKALIGIELVEQLSVPEVNLYKKNLTEISFDLPIKVPSYSERYMDDKKHYTKSNLNVCYATPRNRLKSRDWYETQITVDKKITLLPGYPKQNVPFYVVTDDGYIFKAHTTSQSNKQFSAVGDELILGRWIKGRLVAAGLVDPVNDTQRDVDRKGMITKEMLSSYGCENLRFTKTTRRIEDEGGVYLDVWYLSFETGNNN